MKVVITGGTKGIGKAIADHLIAHGCDIAICARSKDDLETFQKQLKSDYPKRRIITFKADMSIRSDVENFADFIIKKWGTIDILINNTGVFYPGDVSTEPDGKLEKMIETNLYSAYYLTRRLLPVMLNQQSGHIFNMCSVASLKAYPQGGSYSISKYALLGFNDNLREETKNKGIKVTAILPGATWSDSWQGVDLPHDRLMEAHDIAIAVKAAIDMSPAAVIENILLRPQLGDL